MLPDIETKDSAKRDHDKAMKAMAASRLKKNAEWNKQHSKK